MRRERLKEMASVKAAREMALEEEEMFTNNKQKSDEMKRQRETEIELMRMARQEALEEEERLEKMSRLEHARAVSPGLLAAKNVAVNREFADQSQNKMDRTSFYHPALTSSQVRQGLSLVRNCDVSSNSILICRYKEMYYGTMVLQDNTI